MVVKGARIVTMVALLVAAEFHLFAQAAPGATPAASGRYQALVERAKKVDRTLNFRELRDAFVETPQYPKQAIADMVQYRMLWALVAEQKYAEAIQLTRSVIDEDFVNVNAHMVASIAYGMAGDAAAAQFHRFIANGLLNSIRASGDGKSKGTAFRVITTGEEYALVVRVMELNPVGVSTAKDGDHWYDTFTATDPKSGSQTRFFFNVDEPFTAYGPAKR